MIHIIGRIAIGDSVALLSSISASSGPEPPSLRPADQNIEITITDAVLKAAAENSQSGDTVLDLLLAYQGHGIPITQDIVIAAAGNEDLGHQLMGLLLEYDCDLRVSPVALEVAAGNLHHGLFLMTLLLRKAPTDFQITEDVIIAVVQNDTSGLAILALLQKHDDVRLPITENIMVSAAESKNCLKTIDLLIDPDNPDLTITNAILEAAARYPQYDVQALARFLELSGSNVQVTEEIMISAIHSWEKLALLLESQEHVTEDVLIAAAGSIQWCLKKALLAELFDRNITITDAVLQAAAANPVHGYVVMTLLLEHYSIDAPISEDVLLGAATNSQKGPYIIDLVLKRQPNTPITEDIIVAAAATDSHAFEKLFRLLKDSPTRPPMPVTEALVEAISGNGSCSTGALRLLLDPRVEDRGSLPITHNTLVNTAGNITHRYEIMDFLLDDVTQDLENLLTEDVFIAAIGNSLWGLEIMGTGNCGAPPRPQ